MTKKISLSSEHFKTGASTVQKFFLHKSNPHSTRLFETQVPREKRSVFIADCSHRWEAWTCVFWVAAVEA